MTQGECEFESLPTSDIRVHLCAGAISGIMEHIAFYPVDVVKTRLQCRLTVCNTECRGQLFSLVSKMVRNEGLSSLYRGIVPVILGSSPAHAGYYSMYEFSKKAFSKYLGYNNNSPIVHGLSGVAATFAHDIIMNPLEVVKQRLQVCNRRYLGMCDCLTKVLKFEGIFAFYRSLPVQLLMNFPFHSVNIISYEYFKTILSRQDDHNLIVHLCAGAISGGVAAAVTTPLDVIKTFLNVQDPKIKQVSLECRSESSGCSFKPLSSNISGISDTVKAIYNIGGPSAFFRGLLPRIMYHIPSCAISWSVYESFKYILNNLM